MKTLNCPNCGAPINSETDKCPYCNTSYFDFSNIDIDEEEPFFLRIKKGDMYITSLVKAKNTGIKFITESTSYYGYKGNIKVGDIITSRSLVLDIEFESVVQENGTLFTVAKTV